MRNITIYKKKIHNIKIKIISFIINFSLQKPSDIDKCKSKNEASASDTLALFKGQESHNYC